ncbi:MAG: DUF167 domain-containing protein [Gammaproteobacteria bacterium]|nr:DUF167 domain-containing protein [Gammaproteobacteria bacterium]
MDAGPLSGVSWCLRDGADVVLRVLVQPRARREAFGVVVGDRVKVTLTAPPVEGAANAVLCVFLAKQFGVPKRRVLLERGATGRCKRVRIVSATQLPRALTSAGGTVRRD